MSKSNVTAPPHMAPLMDQEAGPDMAFAEGIAEGIADGIAEGIDPDLRYRLISEAAYAMYVARGHQDGYHVDDWLRAEAQVDQLLMNPSVAAAAIDA